MVQPRKIFQSSYKLKRKKFLEYINSRTFPGRKLPNESDLAKILEMSLGTVREILREMEMNGTVTKMKGKGNFLNSSTRDIKMRIDLIKDFTDLIEEKGYQVNLETFLVKDEKDERLMALGEKYFPKLIKSGQFRLIANVYYADATPAVVGLFMVPAYPDFSELTDQEFVSKFWDGYIVEFNHAVIHWEVGSLPKTVSSYLEQPEGRCVQMWSEIHYNKYDELLCCSYSYFNPEIMEMAMIRK